MAWTSSVPTQYRRYMYSSLAELMVGVLGVCVKVLIMLSVWHYEMNKRNLKPSGWWASIGPMQCAWLELP